MKARTFGFSAVRKANRWIHSHLTPAGLFLLAVLTISAVLGLDTNSSLTYQIFTFVASLVALSVLLGLRARPRLEVQRMLPATATAGQPILYRLTIRNLDSKRYSDLTVWETNADDKKPIRLPSTCLSHLAPLGTAEIKTEVTPLRRGKLNLTSVTVSRPDPVGISRRLQTIATDNSILVLPKRYPIPRLTLPGGRKHQPGGVALSSSIGESMEFESLRDYRPGDPVRKIHWRSWARTGKLIVKEYQDEYFVRHGLVLDTFPPTDNPELFEEAVGIAASFACSVLTQESLLDVLFVGAEAYRFTAGRGLGGPEKILEVLACVEPCTERTFDSLRYNVVSRHQSLSGCICVLLAWDDERKELIRHLESLRIPVLAVVLFPPGERGPKGGVRTTSNIHFLEIGKIAEGLAQL